MSDHDALEEIHRICNRWAFSREVDHRATVESIDQIVLSWKAGEYADEAPVAAADKGDTE